MIGGFNKVPAFLLEPPAQPGAAVAALERLRARFEPVTSGSGVTAVGAKYDGELWGVLLLRQGTELAMLDGAGARELAADMVRMADALEGKVP